MCPKAASESHVKWHDFPPYSLSTTWLKKKRKEEKRNKSLRWSPYLFLSLFSHLFFGCKVITSIEISSNPPGFFFLLLSVSIVGTVLSHSLSLSLLSCRQQGSFSPPSLLLSVLQTSVLLGGKETRKKRKEQAIHSYSWRRRKKERIIKEGTYGTTVYDLVSPLVLFLFIETFLPWYF